MKCMTETLRLVQFCPPPSFFDLPWLPKWIFHSTTNAETELQGKGSFFLKPRYSSRLWAKIGDVKIGLLSLPSQKLLQLPSPIGPHNTANATKQSARNQETNSKKFQGAA